MFINELLTCLRFLRIHGVDLGYFWYEGLLEVNGMVKWALWGEPSILWFIEDFSVLSVLWGEFLLNFLHCLGKSGGEGEFPDVGMVFSKYSSMSSCISLLSINPGSVLRLIPFHCPQIS